MKFALVAVLLPAIYPNISATNERHASQVITSPVRGEWSGQAAAAKNATGAEERTRLLVDDVVRSSYPELRNTRIRIASFNSKSDYFKARFGFPQLFSPRMRYVVFVNPRVFELAAPSDAVRAIVAHELAHILYYEQRNRLRLAALIRLASKSFAARFERWADLQAISRGYGSRLSDYRTWLYRNVPVDKLEEKRRNYFSPEEIDVVVETLHRRPELLTYWLKHVPRNLAEVQADVSKR